MLLALVIWLVLAIIIGAAAARRGRTGIGWVFLALILSPLVAAIVLAFLPDRRYQDALSQLAVYQSAAAETPLEPRRDQTRESTQKALERRAFS
jgi:hypothetical protein